MKVHLFNHYHYVRVLALSSLLFFGSSPIWGQEQQRSTNATVMSYPFDYTDNAIEFIEEHPSSEGNLKNLIDNNETSIYKLTGISSTTIIAKLKYPIVLSGYAYGISSGSTNVNNWQTEYSVDGKTWTVVKLSQSNKNNAQFWTFVANNSPSNNPVSAQYYRLTVKGNNSIEIGEWQLFGLPYLSADQHFPNDITSDEGLLLASSDGFERDHQELAYDYTYIYSIPLDIPTGATSVTLPNNSDVVVFAATVSDDENNDIYAASELLDVSMRRRTPLRSISAKSILSDRKIIEASGEGLQYEQKENATDDDDQTKWCDTGNSSEKYIAIDLESETLLSAWSVLHAGIESADFITKDFCLQIKINETDNWQTIDAVSNNRDYKTDRQLSDSIMARYVRLLITTPDQIGENIARIYDFKVY